MRTGFERMGRYSILFGILICAAGGFAADRAAADAYLAGVPALLTSSDYKTAEDLCKRALVSDEGCPGAHFYLATCYEKTNRMHEAYKEYLAAATAATKDKDSALASKASTAAKRLGAGLGELDALDTKLAGKLQSIAAESLDGGQLETAKMAYSALTVLQPDNTKAKEGLEKATKAIEERGDPVRAKVAQATLSEMWYKLGIGEKKDATALATRLSGQYKDTEWGKEAAGLLERDFAAPNENEVALLAKKLKEQNAKKVAKTAPPVTTSTSANPSTTPRPPQQASRAGVDVEALEKAADVETGKLGKDALVPAFKTAHDKGKGYYSKATPGSEGNQDNVAKALEQFIKCASLYVRIENEKLADEELAQKEKDASMLRYACMKMTILSH